MQAYFIFVIFAIVLTTVVEVNGHAVHLLHAMRPRPEYPRDVGNFKDKFHSIDAVRPDDNYLVNGRLLKDSHIQHINPSLSHIQNGMGIANNPLFMRDKRSELKKKKRNEKKDKAKKTKAGKNKGGGDEKESNTVGGNGGSAGAGGKKGKKN